MPAAYAREGVAQPGAPIATQKGYTSEVKTADGVGGGESRGVMGAKGARTNQVEACFTHSPGSVYTRARGVMGCFSLAVKKSEGFAVGLGGEGVTSPARVYCIFLQKR